MNRGIIRLFKFAALLGCGLSAAGLVLAVGLRIGAVMNRPPWAGPKTPSGALEILDAFKDAGATFLLSAILFVVCEIALHRAPPADREPDDPA